MMFALILLAGAGLGALLGYFGSCSTGACPLTANPWRGAIYGMVLGLVFYLAVGRNSGGAPAASSAHVKLVSQAEFETELAQATGPVVVDFFATWCGPCKRLSPLLDELAGSRSENIKFLKVDIDQSSRLASEYRVRAVPTLVMFRGGKEIDRLTGLPARDTLEKRLDAL